jgi:hypothetical protein
VVESPYEDFDDDFTRASLMRGQARPHVDGDLRVDGHTVYEAPGTLIPEHARIGFGIWTMLPIRNGRSRSLDGQGLNARWRRFRVRGVDAGACFTLAPGAARRSRRGRAEARRRRRPRRP